MTVRQRLLDDFMADSEIIPDRTAPHCKSRAPLCCQLARGYRDIGNRRHWVLDDNPGGPLPLGSWHPVRLVPLMAL